MPGVLRPSPAAINLSRCLAESSLRIAGPQRIDASANPIGSFAGCRALAFQGGIEARDQGFSVERLGQIADCASLQRSRPDPFIRERRNENNWDVFAFGKQYALQLYAANVRHLNVGNQARYVVPARGSQKFAGGGKCECGESKRLHKASCRVANGFIVVDD